LRPIDLEVCDYFPVGTHFLWHLLNAVVLYLLVSGVISQARKELLTTPCKDHTPT